MHFFSCCAVSTKDKIPAAKVPPSGRSSGPVTSDRKGSSSPGRQNIGLAKSTDELHKRQLRRAASASKDGAGSENGTGRFSNEGGAMAMTRAHSDPGERGKGAAPEPPAEASSSSRLPAEAFQDMSRPPRPESPSRTGQPAEPGRKLERRRSHIMPAAGRRPSGGSDNASPRSPKNQGSSREGPPEATPEPKTTPKSHVPREPGAPLTAAQLKEAVEKPADVFAVAPHEVCVFGFSSVSGNDARIEPEFEEKHCALSGAPNSTLLHQQMARGGVAAACLKGKKPEQPNQDNYFFVQMENFLVCGVADGHGEAGHWVSHWAARIACRMVMEEMRTNGKLPSNDRWAAIFDTVHEALRYCSEEEGFDLTLSGSTLSICIVDRRDRSTVFAWVGDSRCVASRPPTKNGGDASVSSLDHKPQDPDERRRVIASGGEVIRIEGDVPQRIFKRGEETPGLAMSRAMGDLIAHEVGVVHQPGIKRLTLEAGQFLLCCSDGIWEFIKSSEAVRLVTQYGRDRVSEAVQRLTMQAKTRWLQEEEVTDDITAILMWP